MMYKRMRMYVAVILCFGLLFLTACTNFVSPILPSKMPDKTVAAADISAPTPSSSLPLRLLTPSASPSPSLKYQTATPSISPILSPAPIIRAGTKPFLPINIFQIADKKSVYYVKESTEVYMKDVSNHKDRKIASYDNPIHQMFLDYNNDLYYVVYGYTENYDEPQAWLYKYNNGRATLLLDRFEEVCGVNDKYIYFVKQTIDHEEGGSITDDIYSYDLKSHETNFLFTVSDTEWPELFSSGQYIYYTLGKTLYSYDTGTANNIKIFDWDVVCCNPDIMVPHYIYISGYDNNPDDVAIYNLQTQRIDRVLGNLSYAISDNIFAFYIDGNFLYSIISNQTKHKSTISKIDLTSRKTVKETVLDGEAESAVIDNGKWYIYSDVTNPDSGHISNRRLSSYSLKDGSIKFISGFTEEWLSDGGEDDSVRYLAVSGGYIWGYSLIEGDNGYYELRFSKKIKN